MTDAAADHPPYRRQDRVGETGARRAHPDGAPMAFTRTGLVRSQLLTSRASRASWTVSADAAGPGTVDMAHAPPPGPVGPSESASGYSAE
jgi:hypothetical protein